MSAQVTEAQKRLWVELYNLAHDDIFLSEPSDDKAHQLIADNEAKAVEQANAQVESLLSAAKNAIPASEHPAEPTVENWAWQMRNLGEDRRLVYADRDKLRAEVKESKERERVAIASWDEERQRALREGGRVVELRAERDQLRAEVEAQCLLNGKGAEREADLLGRLERAEREVERLKADGAASAFVAMACRASRAETDRNNLRADKARLDWLEKARPIAWALGSEECGEYWILTDTGEKHPEEAEEFATLRAAIDAAMKEETK